MGKLAGAAVKIAAPEAAAAKAVAGKATGTGTAASHRAQIDAIKAQRPAEVPVPATTQQEPPATPPAPAPAPSSSGPSLPAMPAAAATGSGFLLGVVLWAGALAYLRGGLPEVRKLAAAKFLNRTTGA